MSSHFQLFNGSVLMTSHLLVDSCVKFSYFFELKVLLINLFQADMGSVFGIALWGIKLLQLLYNILNWWGLRIWLIFFYSFYLLIIDRLVLNRAHTWQSELNLWESVLFLHQEGPGDCTQIMRFDSRLFPAESSCHPKYHYFKVGPDSSVLFILVFGGRVRNISNSKSAWVT